LQKVLSKQDLTGLPLSAGRGAILGKQNGIGNRDPESWFKNSVERGGLDSTVEDKNGQVTGFSAD
jgi:hypothetical protein